ATAVTVNTANNLGICDSSDISNEAMELANSSNSVAESDKADNETVENCIITQVENIGDTTNFGSNQNEGSADKPIDTGNANRTDDKNVEKEPVRNSAVESAACSTVESTGAND